MGANVQNSLQADEALMQKLANALYKMASSTKDARQELIEKLLGTWQSSNYDVNALKYYSFTQEIYDELEQELIKQQIPFANWHDDYGNVCVIINSGKEYEDKFIQAQTMVKSLHPEYNKEITPKTFFEGMDNRMRDDAVAMHFTDLADLEQFKNKCFSSGMGFVTATMENKDGSYDLIFDRENLCNTKMNTDLITAMVDYAVSNTYSDEATKSVIALKKAAVLYDNETINDMMHRMERGENFAVGDELNKYSNHFRYDAETKKVNSYVWDETTNSFKQNASVNIDLSTAESRADAKAAMSLHFDRVPNAALYTATDFNEHLTKSETELSDEFYQNRFDEFDTIFSDLTAENTDVIAFATMRTGRPTYTSEALIKYKQELMNRCNALEAKYDFSNTIPKDFRIAHDFKEDQQRSLINLAYEKGIVYDKLNDIKASFDNNKGDMSKIEQNTICQKLLELGDNEINEKVAYVQAVVTYVDFNVSGEHTIDEVILEIDKNKAIESEMKQTLHNEIEKLYNPSVKDIQDCVTRMRDNLPKDATEIDKSIFDKISDILTNTKEKNIDKMKEQYSELEKTASRETEAEAERDFD